MSEGQGERRFPGAVITSDAPCTLSRLRRQAIDESIESSPAVRCDDVTTQSVYIAEVPFEMHGTMKAFSELE
jgi:hypothetical protein